MSVTITDLFPEILMYAPGAPEPTMEHAIRRTADRFFRDTLLWKSTLASFDTVAGTSTYTLTPPANSKIVSIVSVVLDNRLLVPAGETHLSEMTQWPTRQAIPVAYYSTGEGSISLFPVPDDAYPVIATVALTPTTTVTSLDDILAVRYRDCLIAGALMRILGIANQPYSNPTLAATYQSIYATELAKARIDGLRGMVKTNLRVRPVGF